MTQAVGVQLQCGFLSLLLAQATSEFLMNKYGSPNTDLVQFITLTCSCQKSLRFGSPSFQGKYPICRGEGGVAEWAFMVPRRACVTGVALGFFWLSGAAAHPPHSPQKHVLCAYLWFYQSWTALPLLSCHPSPCQNVSVLAR
jgi:hypothetical protein